ncbi:GNAT family N-acetyltransferase [soil metagenome]
MHRLATLDDLPRIQLIERAAGEAFRGVGMDGIADDEPIGEGEFAAFVASWAHEKGLDGLTLTTFRDVPWNAPYYRRLGFTDLPDTEWGPHLRAKVAREAAAGLSRWPRVVMALGASR